MDGKHWCGLAATAAMLLAAPSAAAQARAHPRSYYPMISASDLEACRPQFLAEKTEAERVERNRAKSYLPGGPNDRTLGRATILSEVLAKADGIATMDPITYFTTSHVYIGGGNFIDEVNTKPEMWRDDLEAYAKGADQDGNPLPRPDVASYDWVSFGGHLATGDEAKMCAGRVWVQKFQALHAPRAAPVARQPSPPVARQPVAAIPASGTISGAMTPADIAACDTLAMDKQRESQTWPGDLASRSARLGEYQKELFLGRCAGHPQARKYIANAEAMIASGGANPATTATTAPTPKSPKIYDTPQQYVAAIERGDAPMPEGMTIRNDVLVNAANTASSVSPGSSRLTASQSTAAHECIKVSQIQRFRDNIHVNANYKNICSYGIWVYFSSAPQEPKYQTFLGSGDDRTLYSKGILSWIASTESASK